MLGSIEIASDGERHGRIAYASLRGSTPSSALAESSAQGGVRGFGVRLGVAWSLAIRRRALGYDSCRMATSTQKLAVVLAFVAAALSFAAVAVSYARTGEHPGHAARRRRRHAGARRSAATSGSRRLGRERRAGPVTDVLHRKDHPYAQKRRIPDRSADGGLALRTAAGPAGHHRAANGGRAERSRGRRRDHAADGQRRAAARLGAARALPRRRTAPCPSRPPASPAWCSWATRSPTPGRSRASAISSPATSPTSAAASAARRRRRC